MWANLDRQKYVIPEEAGIYPGGRKPHLLYHAGRESDGGEEPRELQ